MLSFFLALLTGGAVWFGLLGQGGAKNALLGLLVVASGWVLACRFTDVRHPLSFKRLPRRIYFFSRYFLIKVFPAAIVSSFIIAREIIHPTGRRKTMIIGVQLLEATPEALFLISFALTMGPGEQVIHINEETQTIFIHSLAHNPQALQKNINNQYKQYIKEIMP